MDLSFNMVASKCADQMAAYQKCVLANQDGDWGTACRKEAVAVTECADASVPHLADLKRTCANQIHAYRSCLDANGSQSDEVLREKCGESLKALWNCTEKRRGELEKAESK